MTTTTDPERAETAKEEEEEEEAPELRPDLGRLLEDAGLVWAGECAKYRRATQEELELEARVPNPGGADQLAGVGIDFARLGALLAAVPAAQLLGVDAAALPAALRSAEPEPPAAPAGLDVGTLPATRPAPAAAADRDGNGEQAAAATTTTAAAEDEPERESSSDDDSLDALLAQEEETAAVPRRLPGGGGGGGGGAAAGGQEDSPSDDDELDALLNM